MFQRAAVEAIGIPIEKTPGETIDETVNGQHHDLHVGTLGRLVQLAAVIAAGDVQALLKKDVENLVRAGFENGQLDHNKNKLLCEKVKAKVPGREDAVS